MALPYMKLYWGDLLGDTMHLSTLEMGAYLLLLSHQWQFGSLPDNDAVLARITRISPQKFHLYRDVLLSFFDRIDGRLVQKRCAAERDKATLISQLRRDSGEKGGRAKALKTKEPPLAKAKQMLEQTGYGSTDSPTGTESKAVNHCALDHEFAQIVAAYPRRTHRQEGRMAYYEARKVATFRDIIAGIDRMKACLPDDPNFIPSLPKWLLGERWNDEHTTVARKRDRTQEVLNRMKDFVDDREEHAGADIIDITARCTAN